MMQSEGDCKDDKRDRNPKVISPTNIRICPLEWASE